MSDREKLADCILVLTTAHWRTKKSPLLLSNLAPALAKQGFEYKNIVSPLKLKQFIEMFLEGKVYFIEDPRKKLKIGLIPSAVPKPDKVEDVFDRANLDRVQNVKYKIQPAAFAAFIRPLNSGHRRFIDMNTPTHQFSDIPESVAPEPAFIEVPRNLIVENFDTDSDSREKLYANFENWLTENKLKKEGFLYDSSSRQLGHGANLLALIFGNLTDEDLARIIVPLDIAKKLYSK
jgi:hypothetical protein